MPSFHPVSTGKALSLVDPNTVEEREKFIQEIIIPKFNQKTQGKIGPNAKYLGSGHYASAFDVGKNLVLKITGDKEEAGSISKLKGHKTKYLYPILEFLKFSSELSEAWNQTLPIYPPRERVHWVILTKKFIGTDTDQFPQYFTKMLDFYQDIVYEVLSEKVVYDNIQIEKWQEKFKESKHNPNQNDLDNLEFFLMNLDEIIEEGRHYGLDLHNDLYERNLAWDPQKNIFVLIDLGQSRKPPASDVDILEHFLGQLHD